MSEGYVYFVLAYTPIGAMVKIGYSTEHPTQRWHTLRTGSPVPLFRWGYVEGSRERERSLHTKFRKQRDHGEWFSINKAMEAYLWTCRNFWVTEPDPTDYENAVLGWLERAREDGLVSQLEYGLKGPFVSLTETQI